MKREWADTLGGFHAEDIASALKTCRSHPKPPNLPEFASLCRQNMNTRTTKVEPPLSQDEREAAAKVARVVSDALKAKYAKAQGYLVNGVRITPFREWAVNLVLREASGEQIPSISSASWRSMLGYHADMLASKVVGEIDSARAQAKT